MSKPRSLTDCGGTMMLRRITLAYVPVEDRMRLVALEKSGDVILLWLTQRLCMADM